MPLSWLVYGHNFTFVRKDNENNPIFHSKIGLFNVSVYVSLENRLSSLYC